MVCTIGIEPCVELYTPGMSLINPELQRVIVRIRGFALLAGQVV